jgi:hypothetical protein
MVSYSNSCVDVDNPFETADDPPPFQINNPFIKDLIETVGADAGTSVFFSFFILFFFILNLKTTSAAFSYVIPGSSSIYIYFFLFSFFLC